MFVSSHEGWVHWKGYLQASGLVGLAMTYSLFEYAKDNMDDLMPDTLLCSSNVQVS